MIKTIAKTEKYILAVDPAINRVYYTMLGYWKGPEDIPNYFHDWEKALAEMRKGFTVLTDSSRFKTPHASIKPLFDKMQKICIEAGLRKTAELHADNAIVKMSLDSVSKQSNMPKQNFNDRFKAEMWLDKD